jgi:hypothetical protein
MVGTDLPRGNEVLFPGSLGSALAHSWSWMVYTSRGAEMEYSLYINRLAKSRNTSRDLWTRKQASLTRTPRRTGRTPVLYGVREARARMLPRRPKVGIFCPVPVAREGTGTGQHSLDGRIREFRALDRPQRNRKAPAFHDKYVIPAGRRKTGAEAIFAEREGSDEEEPMPPLIPINDAAPPRSSEKRARPSYSPIRARAPGEGAVAEPDLEAHAPLLVPPAPARPKAKKKGRGRQAKAKKGWTDKAEKVRTLRAEQAWEESKDEIDPSWLPHFLEELSKAQRRDVDFGKVLSDIDAFDEYTIDKQGLLWQHDDELGERLCIPQGTFNGRSFREIYLEHVHSVLGHSGTTIMLHTLRQMAYWPLLAKHVREYCRTCIPCQACKTERARARGKLHAIKPPTRAYEQISIDFTGPHPTSYDVEGVPRNYIFTVIDAPPEKRS